MLPMGQSKRGKKKEKKKEAVHPGINTSLLESYTIQQTATSLN
jgi:hypothetical protein